MEKARKFERARQELEKRFWGEIKRLCAEFGVCNRCRNPHVELETRTKCAACAEDARIYQRAYWKRYKKGTKK